MSSLHQNAFTIEGDRYDKYRPSYPPELFTEILKYANHTKKPHGDIACGTGQATRSLVEFYESVIGIDPSKSQLDNAYKHERIKYQLGNAEETNLQNNSVDLITVASALHWLDHDKFFKECDRILKPGGTLAIWSYYYITFRSKKAQQVMDHFTQKQIAKYWSSKSRHIQNCYADISFPYKDTLKKLVIPHCVKQKFSDFVGFISTWSAVRIMNSENPNNTVMKNFTKDLMEALELKSLDDEIEVIYPNHLWLMKKN